TAYSTWPGQGQSPSKAPSGSPAARPCRSPSRWCAPPSVSSSDWASTPRRRARLTSSSIRARSTGVASPARPASARSSASRTRSPASGTRGGSMLEAVTSLPFAAAESLSTTAGGFLPDAIAHLQHEIDERMLRIPTRLNAYGYDPWGFHIAATRRSSLASSHLSRYWFRVETHDIDRVPPGRVLLISNHAGQIALDAAMISLACFLEGEPPRIVRGMGEYWLPTVPWVNIIMVRTGSVVGTRKNCIDLLENEEAVIAFPEG